jgi:hypothetical protein
LPAFDAGDRALAPPEAVLAHRAGEVFLGPALLHPSPADERVGATLAGDVVVLARPLVVI